MRIQNTKGTLVEVFADDNKILELDNGEFTNYTCVPLSYNVDNIKEIPIKDIDEKELLEKLRQEKLEAIIKYDISKHVNEFYVDGISVWIPRETRVSLQNSTEILLKNGIETTTLWEGTMHFVLPCELLLHMLDELEIYALKCFNVTAEHKANVMQIETIEGVENYDYTVGYPEKLSFNVQPS